MSVPAIIRPHQMGLAGRSLTIVLGERPNGAKSFKPIDAPPGIEFYGPLALVVLVSSLTVYPILRWERDVRARIGMLALACIIPPIGALLFAYRVYDYWH